MPIDMADEQQTVTAPGEATPPAFDHRAFLRTLSQGPGVYRMLDVDGTVMYVGKARNLRRRVASYFNRSNRTPKTQVLVSQIADIEVTRTHTESEALILENNLIKALKPRYNVLLRDDKSYPYIHLSTDEPFPRIRYYRGAKSDPGKYFGPYPNARAVQESLGLLQRLFQLRPCEDSVFRNRTRPCLQHQIKRCSAPCVGVVDEAGYREDVERAILFLEGKSDRILTDLTERMRGASERLEFELAARYRDQIAQLRQLQEKQHVTTDLGDVDVVASAIRDGVACVQVLFIRGGRHLGNRGFFPNLPADTSEAELLSAFLSQYYLSREVPPEILVSQPLDEPDVLETVLSEQAERRVRIHHPQRGERARAIRMALVNAEQALITRLTSRGGLRQRFEALRAALELEQVPERLECFDISHTAGEATVASCVVFNREGPLKSDYRRFNVEGVTPGDDYAAMRQALERRYRRLQRGEGKLPDVLFIDGGKGQVRMALEVLEELAVTGVRVVGVAKGPERRPGAEALIRPEWDEPVLLGPESVALHLIQNVRDEAHRFAISGHRNRRGKQRVASTLEDIPGVGAKRRQHLLTHFGGLQGVKRAGVEDLLRVPGVNRGLAERIYRTFHLVEH